VNKRFRVCSHDQPFLLPPSLQDWLPEDHLARFVADVMNELDLSTIYASYERSDGRGLAAYHPVLMARLLLYGYCIGVTSSRKIEQATYDNVAFRYLSADQHPDHDTLAAFRQEHVEALAELFVQALRLCQKAGLVKLGNAAQQTFMSPVYRMNQADFSWLRLERRLSGTGVPLSFLPRPT
jgi:transposase